MKHLFFWQLFLTLQIAFVKKSFSHQTEFQFLNYQVLFERLIHTGLKKFRHWK